MLVCRQLYVILSYIDFQLDYWGMFASLFMCLGTIKIR